MLLGSFLMRDYGMIFVLLLLVGLFSWLTLKEQHPTGSEAGRQVADRIITDVGPQAQVVIVVRATGNDRRFAEAAAVAVERRKGYRMHAYQCLASRGKHWHIARVTALPDAG
jgi:hypothetical protein